MRLPSQRSASGADTMSRWIASAKAVSRALWSSWRGRPRTHSGSEFPDLQAYAKSCDLFVCCHIQSDPSCTYLESLGCGLPIVGYENSMWKGVQQASGAGLSAPIHDIGAAADRIGQLLADKGLLAEMSRKARAFALEHSFEREFARRISSLNDALRQTTAITERRINRFNSARA